MTDLSDRQHDAFDNPAKALCRDGNLRVLREAAYRRRGRLVTINLRRGIRNGAAILDRCRDGIAAHLRSRRDRGRSAGGSGAPWVESALGRQFAVDHGTNVGGSLPQGCVCARSRRRRWVRRHPVRTPGKGLESLSAGQKGKKKKKK